MTNLLFGIYAASQVARATGIPDDRLSINRCVIDLQGNHPFIVREYLHFLGHAPDAEKLAILNPEQKIKTLTMPDDWYTQNGRQLDLVLSYLPEVPDIEGWLAFINLAIRRYAPIVRFLQITLEPNFKIPWIDGSSPLVLEALVKGVREARRLLDAADRGEVKVGFSVAEPQEWLGGDEEFWVSLSQIPRHEFAEHIDYVGLGLYPDAFSPVAPPGSSGNIRDLTAQAIHHLRQVSMPMAGLDTGIPLHISENGSPTSHDRSQQSQAESLSAMIETIVALADNYNIVSYELFGLRDAHSAGSDILSQFGIVNDRYEPKAAYHVYQSLIARYSGSAEEYARRSQNHRI